MKYVAPKGVQAKPIKIPNYPKPGKAFGNSKIWSPEGLNFYNATAGFGGKEAAAQRASAPDAGKIYIGNQLLHKTKKMKKHAKHRKNWIAGAIKKPGALHRELGVKPGKKIPTKKLNAAAKKGGKEGARARLAKTLKGFHHKKHKVMCKKHKRHNCAVC